MPVALNGSIPLPSVRVYTSITVLMMSACLYYALIMTSDPHWRQHANITTPTGTGTSIVGSSPLAASPTAAAASTTGHQAAAAAAAASLEGPSSIVGDAGGGGKLDVTAGPSLLSVQEIETLEEKILAAADLPDLRQMLRRDTVATPSTDDGTEAGGSIDVEDEEDDDERWAGNDTRTVGAYLKDTVSFMATEPFCIWTLINTAYCCLILLGKSIQKFVFGELRISEQQHMKDKFWNFIFYKFIFVFGVVNVQYLYEVILWVSWFSALGFLHLLSQLSKDRFEYLSFSPTTPGWSHFRLISLLVVILTLAGLMVVISIGVGVFVGSFNTFAFMAAECVLLAVRTMHVLIRYGMFLHDMRQGRIGSDSISWDKRGPVSYYIELTFEVAALVVDLVHHVHMLLWSNIFLSMASLVIIMQLRYLFNEIQRKIKKHRNYLWVLNHMEKSYPLATGDDLKANSDNCAICWEKMETARKLPCGHLFHNSCLQSWLEQDTSCPTCRLGLSVHQNGGGPRAGNPLLLGAGDIRIDDREDATVGGGGRTANNHFFHFNGSRYVSWLPNFSVEVTHINNMLRPVDTLPLTAAAANHTSQVRNMARHVQEMFPRYPLSVLIGDLQVSRSIEVTIDNILEGRLQIPSVVAAAGASGGSSPFDEEEQENPVPTTSSSSPAPAAYRGEEEADDDDDQFYPATVGGGGEDRSPVSSSSSGSVSSLSSLHTSATPATAAGYEVERGTKIFGSYDTLLRDDSAEETAVPFGDRFSKSPEEREKILQRRKEQLLAIARRRYLEKNKSELNQHAKGPSSTTVRHRNKSCMETSSPSLASTSSIGGEGSSSSSSPFDSELPRSSSATMTASHSQQSEDGSF